MKILQKIFPQKQIITSCTCTTVTSSMLRNVLLLVIYFYSITNIMSLSSQSHQPTAIVAGAFNNKYLHLRYGKSCAMERLLEPSDLPIIEDQLIRVTSISDTHGKHRELQSLPPSDIFIHAGDILRSNRKCSLQESMPKLEDFNEWLGTVPATHRVVIGGNHDRILEDIGADHIRSILTNAIYLEHESVELCGLKLFGTPLSSGCSSNRAFQGESSVVSATEMLRRCGGDIDILITHDEASALLASTGCCPRIAHVWGHHHAFYGSKIRRAPFPSTQSFLSICACTTNLSYQMVNAPVVVDYDTSDK